MNKMSFSNKFISDYRVLAFISGLLFSLAVLHVIFILAWFCLVPLFIAIRRKSLREFWWIGIAFGAAIPFVTFIPMIKGIIAFTGDGFFFGFLVFLASIVFSALYWAIFMFLLGCLRSLFSGSLFLGALAVSAAWSLIEFTLNLPLHGLPWFACHSGNALAENLYAIQSAAFFGDHLLTFIMVMVNYLFSAFLLRSGKIKLLFPAAIVGVWLGLGAGLQMLFMSENVLSEKPFKLAILSENISPEVKWDYQNGNRLVGDFLELNKIASAQNPDIILWSESAVPWTYAPDDDFIRELRKVSDPKKITHLIGINTEYNGNKLFNSVYSIAPENKNPVRYDKCTALDFIEKPVSGMLFPFFNENGSIVQEGKNAEPLQTSNGKAGVLICNESFLTGSAMRMAEKGAGFLVNPANDGWFSETPAVRQHFFVARLRAVETRKDLAVNSNNGFSGLIEASGKIAMIKHSKEPWVETVTVSPNNKITFYTKYPFLWILVCVTSLVVAAGFSLKTKNLLNKSAEY